MFDLAHNWTAGIGNLSTINDIPIVYTTKNKHK